MRKQLTDEQVEAFRGRLISAAQALFTKHGVAGVTMRQIANALGYSQTAAYRYFANKEEILAVVRAAALNRFCDHLEAACDPAKDARSNANAAGQAFLQFALDEPDSYRLIFDAEHPGKMGSGFAQTVQRFHASMVSYVRPLIDEGFVSGSAETLGLSFCVAAHGAVMMHLSGHLPDVETRDEIHRIMMRLIYRGAKVAPVESIEHFQPSAERRERNKSRARLIKT